MAGFVKDKQLLEEEYKVEDLLDFSNEIQRLDNALKRITYSSLVGYIGKFGSGKSTTIFQLRKQYEKEKASKWFEFDAWKYPERKDLWEGFVLDIAEQVGSKEKTRTEIDGKQNEDKKTLIDVLSGIPFLSSISGLKHFFQTSPATRVFEIQKVLVKILSSVKEKDIFMVVEDIDRSGDAGRYFLETLRQFIKNNLPGKRIIVLTPIGAEVYEKDIDLRASYQKVLDYLFNFQPKNVKFGRFISEIFNPTAFPIDIQTSPNVRVPAAWDKHLEDWFKIAVNLGLSVRELKSVIRFADLAHSTLVEQGYDPDPRIMLAFSLLNHIPIPKGLGKKWIDEINPYDKLPAPPSFKGDNPIYLLLLAIATNSDISNVGSRYKLLEITLVEDNKFPVPVFVGRYSIEEGKYFLSDFYLIPFGQK